MIVTQEACGRCATKEEQQMVRGQVVKGQTNAAVILLIYQKFKKRKELLLGKNSIRTALHESEIVSIKKDIVQWITVVSTDSWGSCPHTCLCMSNLTNPTWENSFYLCACASSNILSL